MRQQKAGQQKHKQRQLYNVTCETCNTTKQNLWAPSTTVLLDNSFQTNNEYNRKTYYTYLYILLYILKTYILYILYRQSVQMHRYIYL